MRALTRATVTRIHGAFATKTCRVSDKLDTGTRLSH